MAEATGSGRLPVDQGVAAPPACVGRVRAPRRLVHHHDVRVLVQDQSRPATILGPIGEEFHRRAELDIPPGSSHRLPRRRSGRCAPRPGRPCAAGRIARPPACRGGSASRGRRPKQGVRVVSFRVPGPDPSGSGRAERSKAGGSRRGAVFRSVTTAPSLRPTPARNAAGAGSLLERPHLIVGPSVTRSIIPGVATGRQGDSLPRVIADDPRVHRPASAGVHRGRPDPRPLRTDPTADRPEAYPGKARRGAERRSRWGTRPINPRDVVQMVKDRLAEDLRFVKALASRRQVWRLAPGPAGLAAGEGET